MRTLQDWLHEYSRTHRNPRNRALHKVCVPAIFVTVVGLLTSIPLLPADVFPVPVTAAWLLIAGAGIFYLRLSAALAVAMVVLASLLSVASHWALGLWGASFTWACAGVFVVAWIGQFVGHKFEGAKPAFFDDLLFLFVGPVWVFKEFINRQEVA